MNYLYHLVPENMKGNFLYPLNELKEKYPEIYREAVKKYAKRKKILEGKIPILNCFWSDVIHLTPVHPKKIKSALIDAGSDFLREREWKWFRINPYSIERTKTVIFLNTQNVGRKVEDYFYYSQSNLGRYSNLPKATISYYRQEYVARRVPLHSHFVPHILYKGRINIKNCEVIEV